MELKIKRTFKASLEFEAYKHKTEYCNTLKTHNCDINDCWGDDTCEEIKLSEEIAKHLEGEKEYKITIQIEEING